MRITIFSDSQACLLALGEWKQGTKRLSVKECRDALNRLGRNNNITLKWIPGHRGLEGNEKVDGLAKEAAKMEFIGPEPALPISKGSIKSMINQRTMRQHKEYWDKSTQYRQSKLLMKEPMSGEQRKYIMKMTRKEMRGLVGVMTGHVTLQKHLHTMGLAETPRCHYMQ